MEKKNPVCGKKHMQRLTEGELADPASDFTATTTELSLGSRGKRSFVQKRTRNGRITLLVSPWET